jgi:hypothetical protein
MNQQPEKLSLIIETAFLFASEFIDIEKLHSNSIRGGTQIID